MTTHEIYTCIYYCLIMSIGLIGFYRIYKTHELRLIILNRCHEYTMANLTMIAFGEKESAYDWCLDKLPSFGKMCWSYKPLKMKYWIKDNDLAELMTMGK